ncbi:Phthiocerol synthesis polyketide synthase type I PpsC [Baekduia alba]|uniref:alcohol dehydrogenase catalytic domain-containing protein n=1 Tax=Baekduia alba TaxID=2997333 RepID=UPI0023407BA8|nr:zinc-binding dehydrogenase [Baekduia alba]WCB91661.1 Phthiocerol synthesis polyketide synthase type I PpsC [Baekduia alba]
MRAATVRDGEIVVEDHPDPTPGHGEVLIRVRAAALNGADMMQKRGLYPAPSGWPQDIPGLDVAGEVAERGPDATRFAVGDRVMGFVGGGGQGELLVCHERLLMPVPDVLDWPRAGGFSEVFTTAHDALFTQGGLTAGERLLIHGAAGGVGTAAVQLARATGAEVVASVRNADHHAGVAALGAGTVVVPDDVDGTFDVILELVGAPNLPANVKSLNMLGRIVVIGIAAGAKGELNLGALMGKRGRISASMLRGRSLEEKALAARLVERHVLPLVARGVLDVPIAETCPLADAAQAYERFAAGGKLGKIVLTMGA